MGRLRKAGGWLSTSDAALGMGERIAGWMVSAGIGSVLIAAGGSVVGWIAGNLLYGLVIGMGVGMLVLMAATYQAVKVASAGNPAPAPNRSRPTAPPTTIVRDDTSDPDDGRLREENERLRAENERLRAENEQYAGQPDAEQLKQRCLRLSGELFAFADERDETDPQKRPEETPGFFKRSQKGGDHDAETRKQYGQRFAGRVAAALDAAQRREWITYAGRTALEGNVKAMFRTQTVTTYIREIAQRLESFGHRL